EALRLPEGQRAVLIEKLLESISAPSKSIREAWVRECDSRMEALQNGEISLIPASQALSEVRASLRT
ncbi:MAG: addiction module protein, partial [Akkermansiaceae bacterium]